MSASWLAQRSAGAATAASAHLPLVGRMLHDSAAVPQENPPQSYTPPPAAGLSYAAGARPLRQ